MIRLLNKFQSIEKDKLQHFASGLILYMICAVFFYFAGVPLIFALLVVLIAGILKEAYDYFYNKLIAPEHTPDFWDAAATFIGGLSGWLCSVMQ